jgi:hypothetical protein
MRDILEMMRKARLSPFSVLWETLRDDDYKCYRDEFYKRSAKKVLKLLDAICEDERGKRDLTEWITTSDVGHEIVTGKVHDEMDVVSRLVRFRSNKDIGLEYLKQWQAGSHRHLAPFTYLVLKAAAETELAMERNKHKHSNGVRTQLMFIVAKYSEWG